MVVGIKNHLFLLLVLLIQLLDTSLSIQENVVKCKEKERLALLKFKAELVDDYGRLSTWGQQVNDDCCRWSGVRCDNSTNHVVALDLRGLQVENFSVSTPLRGNISHSLLELAYLNYLDLSNNDFSTTQIPEFIGSVGKLQYLNLSHSNFVGLIPYHLGNLSALRVLDLGGNEQIAATKLDWLPGFRSLRHLDLSSVALSKATTWLQAISKLTTLQELHLHSCGIVEPFPTSSLPLSNGSSSLSVLDLSGNNLDRASILIWFIKFSSGLRYIDLSFTELEGKIPDDLRNLTSLSYLDLSFNHLEGVIPDALGDMRSLAYLDLSGNFGLEGGVPNALGNMISLAHLDISGNYKLQGKIPDALGNMMSLSYVDLSGNNLQGGFPESYGNLSNLVWLDLSNNKLEGELAHMNKFLRNSNMLEHLDLSGNRFYGSLPPLSRFSYLKTLSLQNNKLNGSFGESRLNLPNLLSLDVSQNLLTGTLPDLASCSSLDYMALNDNMFVKIERLSKGRKSEKSVYFCVCLQ